MTRFASYWPCHCCGVADGYCRTDTAGIIHGALENALFDARRTCRRTGAKPRVMVLYDAPVAHAGRLCSALPYGTEPDGIAPAPTASLACGCRGHLVPNIIGAHYEISRRKAGCDHDRHFAL